MIRKALFLILTIVFISTILLPNDVRALPYWTNLDSVTDVSLSATSNNLVKSGDYLYVVNQTSDSLVIVDASDPTALSVVGSITNSNLDGAIDIAVSGNYAYVVSMLSNRLSVIDISTPSAPVAVASIVVGSFAPDTITIVGNFAYIVGVSSSFNTTLYKVNIATPTSPVVTVSTFITPFLVTGHQLVSGPSGYLYLSNADNDTFYIIDITSGTPTIVGSVTNGTSLNNLNSIAYDGGSYAYVFSDNANNGAIIDVSNPATPSVATTLSFASDSGDIYNNYLYVFTTVNFEVYDISSPLAPVLIDTGSLGRSGYRIASDTTTVFSSSDGFVYSFGDPLLLPVTLDVEFTSATYADVEASGSNVPTLTVSGGITSSSNTIEIARTGGTATGSGTDFSFTSPVTITIPAGNYTTPQTIPMTGLTINNDASVETNETIDFQLQNPSTDVALGTQDTSIYTIIDDDAPTLPIIDVEFTSATYADVEASGSNVPTLTVSGGITSSSNTIEIARTGGTATGSGTDFSFTSPVTITIPAGNYTTPQTIPMTGLTINNDASVETNETIDFQLQNPSTDVALGTQDTSIYTIIDDDALNSSGGDNHGGGGGIIRYLFNKKQKDISVAVCPYFTEYMQLRDRDIYQGGVKHEVTRLQNFLKEQNFEATMPLDGIFGKLTERAVALWQKHYENEILWPWSLLDKEVGTGRFYQSSRRWANMQKGCPESVMLDNGIFLDSDPARLQIFY